MDYVTFGLRSIVDRALESLRPFEDRDCSALVGEPVKISKDSGNQIAMMGIA